ncbi:MAG: hypothetical protein ABF608_11360 [Sporolactobacillus sp.]
MQNTLGDLNNHLFLELERLSDETLAGDALEMEMKRAKAVAGVAIQIIANGQLVLDAKKATEDSFRADAQLPKMLEG